jgi:hypothetical protein
MLDPLGSATVSLTPRAAVGVSTPTMESG